MAILRRAAAGAAGGPRQAPPGQLGQRAADGLLVVGDDGVPVRRLVAGSHQRREGQRIGAGIWDAEHLQDGRHPALPVPADTFPFGDVEDEGGRIGQARENNGRVTANREARRLRKLGYTVHIVPLSAGMDRTAADINARIFTAIC